MRLIEAIVPVGVICTNRHCSIVSEQGYTYDRVTATPELITFNYFLAILCHLNRLAVILLCSTNICTKYISTVRQLATTYTLHNVRISKTLCGITIPCLEHSSRHTIETRTGEQILGVLTHDLLTIKSPAFEALLHVGVLQQRSLVLCFLGKTASKSCGNKTQAQ